MKLKDIYASCDNLDGTSKFYQNKGDGTMVCFGSFYKVPNSLLNVEVEYFKITEDGIIFLPRR